MARDANILAFDWGADVSTDERDRLFDALVGAIRRRRLEVPAVLFLEISAPLGYVAGQGLIFFAPFLAPVMPGGVASLQKVTKLLERPEHLRLLIDRLGEDGEETRTDAARQ